MSDPIRELAAEFHRHAEPHLHNAGSGKLTPDEKNPEKLRSEVATIHAHVDPDDIVTHLKGGQRIGIVLKESALVLDVDVPRSKLPPLDEMFEGTDACVFESKSDGLHVWYTTGETLICNRLILELYARNWAEKVGVPASKFEIFRKGDVPIALPLWGSCASYVDKLAASPLRMLWPEETSDPARILELLRERAKTWPKFLTKVESATPIVNRNPNRGGQGRTETVVADFPVERGLPVVKLSLSDRGPLLVDIGHFVYFGAT